MDRGDYKIISDKIIQNADAFEKARKNLKNMAFAKSNNSVLASIVADMNKENK